MGHEPDGVAIVYCEKAFLTTTGKTAHGLVRGTRRYQVAALIDSRYSGKEPGTLLDGKDRGITIVSDVRSGVSACEQRGIRPTHFVIGIATDGGKLDADGYAAVRAALDAGLNVDSGLHVFLSEDPELTKLASARGVKIRDVRKPPPKEDLHFFTGKIKEVTAFKVAMLGTDSAVGKRTTATLLTAALNERGVKTEMIGTGQTSWLQGARYGFVLDSVVNDFVAGEIEHAVWQAWHHEHPEVIILEGQGSLMNPAFPGGFELIAAGRPDVILVQHAPARKTYDGFPDAPMDPLPVQIQVLEMIAKKPVVAVTLNHEHIAPAEVDEACAALRRESGRPTWDVLTHGAGPLATLIQQLAQQRQRR